ncbi:MAG: M28 family peptidase [Pirellulaceae bacterium]
MTSSTINQTTTARPSKAVSDSHRSANDTDHAQARSSGGKWIYLVAFALIAGLIVLAVTGGLFHRGPTGNVSPTLSAIPAQYDSQRSFSYLKQLCDIGPRPSASPGMKQQQDLVAKHFRDKGADVTFQTFEIRHPEDGSNVPMANLIGTWNADAPKRFLICAHYDTRPFPDQDRRNPKGIFVGANDGASGTAGLMELANQMKDLPANVGVDLVAFDGEEFIFQQGRDKYFLGSNFFAEKYKATPPAVPYQAGVLLDMIGDRELKIYYEVNSLRYAPKVARDIWSVARRLRVRAFVPKQRHEIQDDHLPLNQIAQIPTVDLIDFDYPREGFGAPSFWHTEQDIPANCSGESIAAVVWVVHEWLKKQ